MGKTMVSLHSFRCNKRFHHMSANVCKPRMLPGMLPEEENKGSCSRRSPKRFTRSNQG